MSWIKGLALLSTFVANKLTHFGKNSKFVTFLSPFKIVFVLHWKCDKS
jgi:hypothetical protein